MPSLPAGFEDLEHFAATWALSTETQRNTARRTTAMPELTAFYDAMLVRMPAIVELLKQHSPAGLPEVQQHLLWMACSFMEVAMAVELFKEPDPLDAFPAGRYRIQESPL